MNVKHQFRIYPTSQQRGFLAKQFGCVRYAYNWALGQREKAWKAGEKMGWVESDKAFNQHKKAVPFLAEVSSVPLQQALRHLQTAYVNFFQGRAAKPGFKRKFDRQQAAEYTRNGFVYEPSTRILKVAKLGVLKVRWSMRVRENPTSVTITKDASGRYFVTLTVDEPPKQKLPATGRQVGVDLGLNSLLVTSDGETIEAQRTYRKAQRKLAKAQRVLARRVKGSRRREQARVRVARVHARIGDTRKDFLDKVTTDLVRRYDVIAIEDLCVKGMARGMLAKSVADAGFGMFRRMLEYKCDWYGRELRLAPRFHPSTNTCSACKVKLAVKLTLSERTWTCEHCGAKHGRDHNAAKEILAAGQAVTARGGDVRPRKAPALRGSSGEARTSGGT